MTKVILAIILGLIASTIVGFLYFKNIDTSMQGTEVDTQVEEGAVAVATTSDEIKGKNSIMSLFSMGKSMECTFVFSTNGVRGEGTGFFDAGNARVDALYTSGESSPTASYILSVRADNLLYTWSLNNGVTQGKKVAIQTEGAESPVIAEPQGDLVTTETVVEYVCKPWSADNSVFVPPSDVTFTDMTAM